MSARPRPRPPLTSAQADLAARHAGRAVALARRLRPWDADEAESEALLILAEAARDWPGEASGGFPGFLKSRLRLRLRPDTDRGSVAARPGGDLADRPADAGAETEPTVAVLADRLAALPRTWQVVLRLRYGLDGEPALTVAEAARRLRLPADRVRRAERAALARLRRVGQGHVEAAASGPCRWTEKEEEVVRREYGEVTAEDLARRLGRTKAAVQAFARRNGISGRPGRRPRRKGA
jgi:DNA-directed RNA polymerase specialized sigma24 family protein